MTATSGDVAVVPPGIALRIALWLEKGEFSGCVSVAILVILDYYNSACSIRLNELRMWLVKICLIRMETTHLKE